MILDLDRFLRTEEPYWRALEKMLEELALRTEGRLSLQEAERLQDLYNRAATDLNRVQHGAAAPELTAYLEQLVARAYGEIYQSRASFVAAPILRAFPGFFIKFPRVLRKHAALLLLSCAVTLAGCSLGAVAVLVDPAAVDVFLPADYLRNPVQRVNQEEHGRGRHRIDINESAGFSAFLMTHNIQVSIFALFLGVTLGIGTGLLLFGNGIILGAVVARYAAAGKGAFVAGWLLPHGSFEIPSILIAGQAGFLIARCLLRGGSVPRWQRVRAALPDILTLAGGLSCMLVWAGLVEGFFSQHHSPEIAYGIKISFGLLELTALALYVGLVGRGGSARRLLRTRAVGAAS